jgi:hypothetical protein
MRTGLLIALLVATLFYLTTGIVYFEGSFDGALVVKPYPMPVMTFGGGEAGAWARHHPGEKAPWYMEDDLLIVTRFSWEEGEPTALVAYALGYLAVLLGWIVLVIVGAIRLANVSLRATAKMPHIDSLAAAQSLEYRTRMSVSECSDALNEAVDRLEPLLQPLGFHYVADVSGEGHMPFASGFFVGTAVKIGLVFRKRGTLGCVVYENESSNMSHDDLVRYLGVQDRQRLVYNDATMASQARDGGEAMDALAYDLDELIGQRLNDPVLMRQVIARSLHERFPTQEDCSRES